ncbi:MAG TPA: LLM class flavin-dependent oxidoreductase [Actinomycetota bacterium]|jgi:probable F420-dependent oxidoreductase|nr:LLM class flavin-dependent oxidoreductase [Actinomycetota bacterium]
MPDVGIVVAGPLAALPGLARAAEERGYESVWVAETSSTAYVQVALVAEATSRVRVGTDIALAFPRSPTVTAMTARDLAEVSGDRFILGLGSQVKRINERRFSVPFEHPAPKMEEYVEVVRAVLGTFRGEPIDHRGRFFTVTMPPFPGAMPVGEVPIYLAAVNARMCEAAGRVGDGVLGHPLTSPKYVAEVVRPAVERGATAAGRDPADVSVTTSVILQLGDDDTRNRFEAALQIGFYATTRTYAPVLALHGFEDRVGPLREAYAAGDLAKLAELSMPMVDTFAVTGPAEECRERLAAFDGLVDRIILGGAWVGPDRQAIAENFRRILDTFSPAA